VLRTGLTSATARTVTGNGGLACPSTRRASRRCASPSVNATAPTERDSVRGAVPEQAPNRRDFVALLFGCTALDREVARETGESHRTVWQDATALVSSPTKNGLVRNYAVPARKSSQPGFKLHVLIRCRADRRTNRKRLPVASTQKNNILFIESYQHTPQCADPN